MSKHRETKGNPYHGMNTLLIHVPETLTLAKGRGKYHGSTCGQCVHFVYCEMFKGIESTSPYCHLTPPRFEAKGEKI